MINHFGLCAETRGPGVLGGLSTALPLLLAELLLCSQAPDRTLDGNPGGHTSHPEDLDVALSTSTKEPSSHGTGAQDHTSEEQRGMQV